MNTKQAMKWVLAGSLAAALPCTGFAQQKKEGKEELKASVKGSHEQIIISRSGDAEGKTVIEIDGDKIKVNGKEYKDGDKDGDVNIMRLKTGPRGMAMTSPRGNWNMDFNGEGFDLFTEDSNRAMLGVSTDNADGGARIAGVNEGSAAEKAGLKTGDIITRINDKDIDDPEDVTEAIRARKPGEKVTVTYKRDGKTQTATAELTSWKGFRFNTAMVAPRVQLELDRVQGQLHGMNESLRMMPPMSPTIYGPGRPRLGLSIQDTEDGNGVKVLDVDDESVADKAGIKENDIITTVNGQKVTSTQDMARLMRSNPEQSSAYNLEIRRGNRTERVEVKFPKRLRTTEL